MSDNVIILGAGASHPAGIPLMAGFVEKMWEFAVRKQVDGEPMSTDDIDTFQKAIEVKNELDSYHGRAMFDDRNLEDIISILSFNEIQGSKANKNRLFSFTKAISRTIELACRIKHDGENRIQGESHLYPYHSFWRSLFRWYVDHKQLPTIISLNYDLVLERSLFGFLIGISLGSSSWQPLVTQVQGVEIKYHYDPIGDFQYVVKEAEYDMGEGLFGGITAGTKLERGPVDNPIRIEILKLHGSLNFPRTKTNEPLSLVHPVDNPFILPPIINKMSSAKSITKMWATALQRLRTAKNIIIVGYSLPRIDIYMQYFLKTALGPNVNLNRIYVFDPVLFRDDPTSKEMMDRYGSCFSPQLQDRIVFRPPISGTDRVKDGTFDHFVERIGRDILF